ncbi:LacI family DNA-binding transcriptional regulator [Dactylosporangium sp. CA-092794]|uniref:LacI family DNA-binding transcriptional regulator n=1 Tax=Dactylosporangium sp. CA-092794 TaxID=3239929 RepID=UPI003D93EB35
MTPQRAVTLKDVAQHAGVSVRTVSNVVNDWPHVTPALRQRVQASIDKLGYRPNLTARNLRSGRTGMIGVVVPDIRSQYFAELTQCLIKEFSDQDFTVVIEQTDGKLAREREILLGTSRSTLFDGVVFSTVALSSEEFAHRKFVAPVVLLGEQLGAEADHVLIDNVRAARTATSHLVQIGRRRIAFIGRQEQPTGTALLREQGFRQVLDEAGLPCIEALMPVATSYSYEAGARAARQLIAADQQPDAAFCSTDSMALGAMHELRRAGFLIPRDIAVVGFDDIEEGRYSNPTLSSISPDKSGIAATAARLLVARLKGEAGPAELIYVDHHLAIRESSHVDVA